AERDLSEEEVFNETTDKLGHIISRKSDIYVPESDTSKDTSKQESTMNISQEFFVADSDNEEQEKDYVSAHPSIVSVPEDALDQFEHRTDPFRLSTDSVLTCKSDHNHVVPSLDTSLRTKVFSRIEPEGWKNISHSSLSSDNKKSKMSGNSFLNQSQLSKSSQPNKEMEDIQSSQFNQSVTNIETHSKVLSHKGSSGKKLSPSPFRPLGSHKQSPTKRITPLRVASNLATPTLTSTSHSPFQKALASSAEVSFKSSSPYTTTAISNSLPKMQNSFTKPHSSTSEYKKVLSATSPDTHHESPILTVKSRNKNRIIESDSEDDDFQQDETNKESENHDELSDEQDSDKDNEASGYEREKHGSYSSSEYTDDSSESSFNTSNLTD
ncbi:dentin sialophosphoprotein-like, partial [Limulus polyphemus]|uniref:Dentin sialophosphoprotein-like n=1 Tax=Limulus polyphemus TaxID=6850 RepID=A0ABM1RZT9_LIMPO